MPFSLVTGDVGGGKTMYCVSLAAKCFKEGGYVHSNIDWEEGILDAKGWAERHVTLDGEPENWKTQLVGGTEHAPNLLVFDEAWFEFHAWDQMKRDDAKRRLFNLFAMSRKLGLDIYFIVQDANTLDKKLRDMAEYRIHCININKLPSWGWALNWFCGDFRRTWTNKKGKSVKTENDVFDPDIAGLYRTDALKGEATEIKRHATRAVVQRSGVPVWFLFVAVAVVGFLVWSYGLWRRLSTPEDRKPVPSSPASPPVLPPPVRSEPSSAPRKPSPSQVAPASSRALDPRERLLGATRIGTSVVLFTLEGDRVEVGRPYDGRIVHQIERDADWWFVTLSDGGMFVIRPPSGRERSQLYRKPDVNDFVHTTKPSPDNKPWNPFTSLLSSSAQ